MPTSPAPAPVGGDPSKPGAWTEAQIADWERVKTCPHDILGPYDDTCGRCGAVVRYRSEEPDFETITENRLLARQPYTD